MEEPVEDMAPATATRDVRSHLVLLEYVRGSVSSGTSVSCGRNPLRWALSTRTWVGGAAFSLSAIGLGVLLVGMPSLLELLDVAVLAAIGRGFSVVGILDSDDMVKL